MEVKLLNFPTAMRVADIVKKYVQSGQVVQDKSPLDFIESFMNVVDPHEYGILLRAFTGATLEELHELEGKELLKLLFIGLEKNKILSLLDAQAKIGL